MPEDRAFTNQIQTKCMCYNYFISQCVSISKVPLVCAWHEEQFSIVGPVPWNSASDGKPWVSVPLSWNRFTMLTHVTFLALGLLTNIPLTLITSWLLALYVRKVLCIIIICMLMASQNRTRPSWSWSID